MPTQEELLEEALITEKENLKSLGMNISIFLGLIFCNMVGTVNKYLYGSRFPVSRYGCIWVWYVFFFK